MHEFLRWIFEIIKAVSEKFLETKVLSHDFIIVQAEADEIDADEGDPIDAPPGPYKIQPEYQGRLVWLTGPPGTGKSTTAQLLGRLKGWLTYRLKFLHIFTF